MEAESKEREEHGGASVGVVLFVAAVNLRKLLDDSVIDEFEQDQSPVGEDE